MCINNRLIAGMLTVFAIVVCANDNVIHVENRVPHAPDNAGDGPGHAPGNIGGDNRNPDAPGREPGNVGGGNRNPDAPGREPDNTGGDNRNPDATGNAPDNASGGNLNSDTGQGPNNAAAANSDKPFGFFIQGGTAFVVVPGSIPLCTPEFWRRMDVTLPEIRSKRYWRGKILVSQPKINEFIPFENLPRVIAVSSGTRQNGAVSSGAVQGDVEPFGYGKEQKHFRFVFSDGQVYETWNVIVVRIPGRVKRNSQEFNERMSATISKLREEYWHWIPIYIDHPIRGRTLYEPVFLVWPFEIPFR